MIADDGEQLGVVPLAKAMELARGRELDLVEVSPGATPPVCKLMNFGKYTYQQNKKAQEARKNQTKIQVKDIRFRPKIDEHDYNFKKNHVLRFLKQGDKVKATIMFRGREIVHVDYGRRILERLLQEIEEHAVVETPPKQEGNQMHMVLAPRKVKTAKPGGDDSRPQPDDDADAAAADQG